MSAFKPALLIIDLQEDFLPPNGSLAIAQGREIIPVINKLADKSLYNWSIVIASKDWHPRDHCSFASNNPGSKPYHTVLFHHPNDPSLTKEQVVWPDHCVQNTHGANYPVEFNSDKTVDVLVKKGYLSDREYYSAFADVWNLHQTELASILAENGITHVYVCGLAYDYCVQQTSIDAAKHGWPTYVISDAAKAVDPSKLDTDILQTYTKGGVKVITTDSEEIRKVHV